MINGNTIHYIPSGMAHTRISAFEDPRTIAWTKSVFKKLTTDDYQFGLLYNAYTEKRLGNLFSSLYAEDLCDIHADSGGLQMITLGHQITPEMKNAIYEHQAKCSTIAMSFDEIPVTAGNGVTDFTNRQFNSHLVEEKAKLSGQNLVDQLKLFAERKTKAKPLLIAQGNCMDTYLQWVDVVQKQIPSELLPALGGIALAGSSMGSGDLENVRTAFYFTQMDLKFDCKQVHLLGVGSLSRFVPTMVLMKNGMYKDLVISLDSTTHTSGISRNTVLSKKNQFMKLGRTYSNDYEQLFEQAKFFDIDVESPQELFKYLAVLPGPKELKEAGEPPEVIHKFLQSKFALFAVSSKNFVDLCVDYLNNRNLHLLTRKEMYNPMKALYDVRNKEDFHAWERAYAKYLRTNAVARSDQNATSIEEFFV